MRDGSGTSEGGPHPTTGGIPTGDPNMAVPSDPENITILKPQKKGGTKVHSGGSIELENVNEMVNRLLEGRGGEGVSGQGYEVPVTGRTSTSGRGPTSIYAHKYDTTRSLSYNLLISPDEHSIMEPIDRSFCLLLALAMALSVLPLMPSADGSPSGGPSPLDLIVVDPGGDGDYTTIQAAVDAAQPGDTIAVRAGLYTEAVTISKTLTLTGDGADLVTISTDASISLDVTADHVNVSGVTVKRPSDTNTGQGIRVFEADSCTVSDCNVTDHGNGIFASSASDLMVRDCSLYSNNVGMSGYFWIGGGVSDTTIHHSGQKGITLWSSRHLLLDGLTLVDNDFRGLEVQSGSYNITLQNSTAMGSQYSASINNADHCAVNKNVLSGVYRGVNIEGGRWTVCRGNTISSEPTTQFMGVYVNDAEQFRIEENTLSDGNKGVNLYKARSGQVLNNTMGEMSESAVELSLSQNCVIDGNVMADRGVLLDTNSDHVPYYSTHTIGSNNTVAGKPVHFLVGADGVTVPGGAGQVILVSSSNVTVTGQNTSAGGAPLLVAFCTDINITDNNCSGCWKDCVRVRDSPRSTIARNVCSYVGTNSIYLTDSPDSVIRDNTCIKAKDFAGVMASSSDGLTVENNTIRYCGYSILISQTGGEKYLVRGNSLYRNSYGLELSRGIPTVEDNDVQLIKYTGTSISYVSGARVVNNTFTGQSMWGGFCLSSSTGSYVAGNLFATKWYGASVHYSDDNLFVDNTFTMSDAQGVRLFGCSGNNFTGNEFSENDVNVEIMGTEVTGNTFHHNVFVNATSHVTGQAGSNHWDDGVAGGNYWDDYEGEDDGSGGRIAGDGIGDTEIPHPTANMDNYPYMEPWSWMNLGVPELSCDEMVDVDGVYTLSWTGVVNADGYALEEDDDEDFPTPKLVHQGGGLSHQVNGQDNGTYHYRVRAYNSKIAGLWSLPVTVTVDLPPEAPSGLKVQAGPQEDSLKVSWDANKVDTVSYELQFRTDGGWSTLVEVDHPSCQYIHGGLSWDVTYRYKVRAADAQGQLSDFSGVVIGSLQDTAPPLPPVLLKVEALTHDSMRLTWEAVDVDDVSGYNVYRSTEVEDGALVGADSPVNDDPIAPGNPLQYKDKDLEEETVYYYHVTALYEVPKESDPSNVLWNVTLEGLHAPVIAEPLDPVVIEEDTTDTSINLFSWFTDPDGDALEYSCPGGAHIDVTIDGGNGTVELAPGKDWSGEERLKFTATDGEYKVSGRVNVTVTPVNDPPGPAVILMPANDTVVVKGTPMVFSAVCQDPDLPYGDHLNFSWTYDDTESLGLGPTLTNVTLPTGRHRVDLTVWDEEGVSCGASVHVRVKNDGGSDEVNKYDSDGDGMPDAWEVLWDLDPYDPSDADEDPDRDLLTNLEEYLDGTNPRVSDLPVDMTGDDETDPPGGGDTDGDPGSDKGAEAPTGAYAGAAIMLALLVILIMMLARRARGRKEAPVEDRPPETWEESNYGYSDYEDEAWEAEVEEWEEEDALWDEEERLEVF